MKFSLAQMALLICLLMVNVCFSSAYATTLAQRDGQVLTTQNINQMIQAGEFIAGNAFTPEEKQALHAWAIELFDKEKALTGVMSGFDKYARYLALANKHTDPDLKAMIWHHFYREMVFKWRFPKYGKQQLTLLDVIQRYNPVIKRLGEQQLLLTQKEPLLAEKDGYFFSQSMWTALRVVVAFLGRSDLSDKDEADMYTWALADFNNAPAKAAKAYAVFFDTVVPNALSPQNAYTQEQFRAATYQEYFFLFRDDPLSKQWPGDLMDVVTRNNPVLVIDDQNRLLIAESEWRVLLDTAQYFSDQLQLKLDLSPAYQQAERQQLISRFINRSDTSHSVINSSYLLRTQAFWEALPEEEKQAMSVQFWSTYLKNKNIWQTLNPLFVRLDAVIQAENQQQLLEQQLMAEILMQQLRVNQVIFNNTLKAHREVGNSISRAIQDQSTHHTVGILGGKVLQKHKGHFLIENSRGERYRINRSP